jgi:hypothetical protein
MKKYCFDLIIFAMSSRCSLQCYQNEPIHPETIWCASVMPGRILRPHHCHHLSSLVLSLYVIGLLLDPMYDTSL